MQSPTSITGGPSQPSTSAATSQFSFAQSQPVHQAQRRPTLQSQGLGGMGGMGGSMRPPGKSGLNFDHILSRLQSELQKSRETGAELHSLTSAMNDIHDTLGGAMVRSHYLVFSPTNDCFHSHPVFHIFLLTFPLSDHHNHSQYMNPPSPPTPDVFRSPY